MKGNEGADPNMVGARSQRTLVGQPKTGHGEWLIGPLGVSKEQRTKSHLFVSSWVSCRAPGLDGIFVV